MEDPFWFPHPGGYWLPLTAFGDALIDAVFPRAYRARVHGREHLPANGGVLLVANHVADVDPAFLAWASLPRRVEHLTLARHFTFWPMARLLSALGSFPIRTGRPDPRAMRHARDRVAAGGVVVIFPEGRPTGGARLDTFHEGVGHIATHTGAPVVPVALWGTQRVVRGGWFPVGRGPVHVAFGPPVPPPAGGGRRERAEAYTRLLQRTMQGMVDALVASEREGG